MFQLLYHSGKEFLVSVNPETERALDLVWSLGRVNKSLALSGNRSKISL